jgi:hypothetical protein
VPIPAGGVRVGSVSLDAYDAEHVADLLAHAALVIGALAGQAEFEAVNTELAPDPGRSLTQLQVELACAQADLDEAVAAHTGTMPA